MIKVEIDLKKMNKTEAKKLFGELYTLTKEFRATDKEAYLMVDSEDGGFVYEK